MAKIYSREEQRANWLKIDGRLQMAISNLSEKREERNLYRLFGEDLSKFMMHPSNTKNRGTLDTCGITFIQDKGSSKKILISKSSSIPPYFYTDPHAMDVDAAEKEEPKLKQASSLPASLVETMYAENFEDDVKVLVAKILSKTKTATGPFFQSQMAQMLTERVADELFAGSDTKHSDTLIVDEAQKALRFVHSKGTRTIDDQTAHNTLLFSLYPPKGNKSRIARRLGINRKDSILEKKNAFGAFSDDTVEVELDTRDPIRESVYQRQVVNLADASDDDDDEDYEDEGEEDIDIDEGGGRCHKNRRHSEAAPVPLRCKWELVQA